MRNKTRHLGPTPPRPVEPDPKKVVHYVKHGFCMKCGERETNIPDHHLITDEPDTYEDPDYLCGFSRCNVPVRFQLIEFWQHEKKYKQWHKRAKAKRA